MCVGDWSSDVCSSDLSTLQTRQAQLHSPGQLQSPRAPASCGGLPSPILQSSTSQLSGESSELPGDRVHSGCMTSGIRLGPVGSGQSEIQFLCISSAPEAPTLSYSLMPVLSSQVFPEHNQAAGRGFRAGQELQHLTVNKASHELTPNSGRASMWSETDSLMAQVTAPGSLRAPELRFVL